MLDMRNHISDMRHDATQAKTFIQLRTLLEILETIGYFANKGYIDENDINQLIGGTIEYYYEVFGGWIYFLQDTKDKRSFQEFESLVFKLNKDLIPEERRGRYETP